MPDEHKLQKSCCFLLRVMILVSNASAPFEEDVMGEQYLVQ